MEVFQRLITTLVKPGTPEERSQVWTDEHPLYGFPEQPEWSGKYAWLSVNHARKQFVNLDAEHSGSNAAENTVGSWKSLLRQYNVRCPRNGDYASYLGEWMMRKALLCEAAGVPERVEAHFAFPRISTAFAAVGLHEAKRLRLPDSQPWTPAPELLARLRHFGPAV